LLQDLRLPAGPEGADTAKNPVVNSMAGFELVVWIEPECRYSQKWPHLKKASVPTSRASEPPYQLFLDIAPSSRDEQPLPARSAEGTSTAAPTISRVAAQSLSGNDNCRREQS